MANKSGDNSLRDWFGKSKSSDGTPGWVQLGGKYAGKPCARQPGQKTKPKCGSSKMKRNLNKKEEQKAFRRKNAKDPNPNRKGKAINVATEETTTSLFRRLLDEKKKCWKGYKKVGTQKLFGKTYNRCVKAEEVAQEGLVTGALAAGAAIGGAAYLINKAKKAAETQNDKAIGKPTIQGVTSGIRKRNERIKELMNQDYEMEGGDLQEAPPKGVQHADDPKSPKQYQIGDYIDNSAAVKKQQKRRMGTLNRIIKGPPKDWDFSQQNVDRRMMTGESSDLFDIVKGHLISEHELSEDVAIQVMTLLDEEIKADILEYTAAIRADAAPKGTTMKITATGKEPAGDRLLRGIKDRVGDFLKKLNPKALKSTTVEPRKPLVSTQKNSFEPQGELVDEKYETSPNTDPMIPKSYNERMRDSRQKSKKEGIFLPPWIGPELPRVKSKSTTQMAGYEPEGELMTEEQFDEAAGEKDACYHKVKSRYSVWPSAYASGALVKCRKVGAKNWGNKTKKEGYELGEMATEKEVDKKLQKKVSSKDLNPAEYIKNVKMMPGSGINKKLMKNSYSWRDELEYVQEGSAWTKKSGKDPDGGLNEKGRKSYERENPGSDLKRPSKKVGNKRRASFCARMKGMKKKLTSKKTANDPDSRINKSLRAWNC